MSESVGRRGLVLKADSSWREAFWPRRSGLERDQAVSNVLRQIKRRKCEQLEKVEGKY